MGTAISEFTGEPVDTYSEAWRHECEVRHVVDRIPTRELRNAFLARVSAIRGQAAADQLRADAMRLWEIRQARKKAAELAAG